jgi:hypothetical protein
VEPEADTTRGTLFKKNILLVSFQNLGKGT